MALTDAEKTELKNDILNAIKAKDAEKAGNLATIHIMHVMENLHIEEK